MPISPPAQAKILLVDDNRDGLLVRKSLLEEVGYGVSIATGGEEALRLFKSLPFDVVVTDYRMPGMNGAELIDRMRKLNPNSRVILLSGFVDPLGLTEETTGADVVIAKSAQEPQHLVRWVRRLVNRATPRKPPGSQNRSSAPRARASAR
jgi:CheY-like chemotaxis protein